ncbi:MAG: T9SS type A sorting domain-containing protein [Sphingomonadales bacterium]|jgi:PKD repeat protein
MNNLKLLGIVLFGCFFTLSNAQKAPRNYGKKVNRTYKKLVTQASKQKMVTEEADKATPDLFWAQEYIATMDPTTGKPTPEKVMLAIQQSLAGRNIGRRAMPGMTATPWVERGPNNVGGRTRALSWDPTDPTGKKVWAGAVTGGLWYNNDITNANSKWMQVSSLWSNLTVSCMAWDPVNPGTCYVGTGEGFGTSSSTSRGFGIWKTSDSGKTWNQLTSTTSYFYVLDIAVRNENGNSVVYAAVDANFYQGITHGTSSYGLFRSTNGGTSWTNVISNAPNGARFAVADIEIASDNRIWVGTRNNPFAGTDRGAGRVMFSDNGTIWTTSYSHTNKTGRVEVATAPGKSNTVYAMIEHNQTVDAIVATFDKGANWTTRAEPDDADNGIPNTDFSRNQAWYDLILAVDPNDSLVVYAGAINLFRSANGGNSWTQISKWANNANMNTLNCPYVHADQHAFVFKPGSSSTCIIGNDGGVFYSNNIGAAATSSTAIVERTFDYSTVQYYWGDMSQTAGSSLMIAGAQDNGSHRFTNAGKNAVSGLTGGDGAYCFISQSNSNKQITSYVYNQYYYTLDNWITPTAFTLINDGTTGRFINPAEWDDNGSGIFSARGNGTLYRRTLTTAPGTLQTITFGGSNLASAIKAYRLSTGKTRLWVGNDAGKLYVTDDAWATTPAFTEKTGTINVGNISDIHALRGGDTLAVTLSNYGSGMRNIYISLDGGNTWTQKEGNLPDIPVWSILLNPNKIGEAIVGTESGIYGTDNIFATSPVWTAYTAGIGFVKMRNLRYRASDKLIMAVTHGRGVFTSDAWAKNLPIPAFGTSSRDVCSNQSVVFTDSTINDPTSWSWAITPRNVIYLSGTDSTNKNPVVRFTKGGIYQVKLTATNSIGSNFIVKSNWITVTDTIPFMATVNMSRNNFCAGDTFTLSVGVPTALQGSITSYTWRRNFNNTVTTPTYNLAPAKNDSFSVLLTSNKKCVSPTSYRTAVVKPTVNDIVNASAKIIGGSGCTGRPLLLTVSGTNTGSSPVWSWFKNGTPVTGTAATLTISAPMNGDKYWATVNVSGPCVRPSNLIQSDTAILVVNNTPAKPQVTRNFDTLFAQNLGAGTYQWYKAGTLAGSGRVFKATSNGNYRCVYTENGCASDTSQPIIFSSLSLNNISSLKVLFPNPAASYIMVPAESSGSIYAGIFDSKGTLIRNVTLKNAVNNAFRLDINDLLSGSYIIQTRAGKTYRFIKE